MMRLMLILIFVWQGSVAVAAPKLEGQWKSNKALTVATFSLPDDMPDDLRDRWCNVFGEMLVTYTDGEALLYCPANDELGEYTDCFEYRVEVETKNKLVLVTTDPETGEVTKETLHFVSPDRYYVSFDVSQELTALRGAREYFDRVDVSEQ